MRRENYKNNTYKYFVSGPGMQVSWQNAYVPFRKPQVQSPANAELGMAVYPCGVSTQGAEAEGLKV